MPGNHPPKREPVPRKVRRRWLSWGERFAALEGKGGEVAEGDEKPAFNQR